VYNSTTAIGLLLKKLGFVLFTMVSWHNCRSCGNGVFLDISGENHMSWEDPKNLK
jgi:hypothetical protein